MHFLTYKLHLGKVSYVFHIFFNLDNVIPGTSIGDPVECAAIDGAITQYRKEPLLVGSVKSNIGHAEGASGMGSLAKVVLALETGIIPPNINFNAPNPKIPALIEGRLQVVTEPKPLPTDYVCTYLAHCAYLNIFN
ncbi:unnamed protein product [Acanthoscelides obtectus]|uniref:Ketosynthase family 3 (KS3) domain-containing protein n=1 Tax=Acanthoscelides obtectus TaxID=200917 RepID=A0A9P0PGE1_ACAOB|nr:unnamed protein product [Acanthoscelides obtectus]CAK1641870.1 Fatty acid synthase [Acanthoscelides obtectus]